MFSSLVTKFFGNKYERDLKKIQPIVLEINDIYETLHDISDEDIKGRTAEYRARIDGEREAIRRERTEADESPEDIEKAIRAREGEILDELLPEAYATVKEVCRRLVGTSWSVSGQTVTWDMIPYDVQLVGAIVLHQGKIAEMATGEGKTLVASMPLYLNALTGRGVHLVTINDYLARRDQEWMGKIYDMLGLTVDCLQNEMDPSRRKIAYTADITYGTNNEFGFDYLRDNYSTFRSEDMVQRPYYYAIVDEVDFVLIDEARTPLIISGPVSESTHRYDEMKPLVDRLVRKQTALVNGLVTDGAKLLQDKEGGYQAGIELLRAQRGAPKNKALMKLFQEEGTKKLVARVESDYMRDKQLGVIDEELYFAIDEKSHTVDLTEKGRQALSPGDEDLFLLPDLSEELQRIEEDETLSVEEKHIKSDELDREYATKSEKVHNVTQLLKAYSLFVKDVDYVVDDGRVMIVDEFTGRLMPGRRFSDGLHEALEAKEGVKIQNETQTLATITLQNLFRLYQRLAGMTGTAETEAGELFEIYKLDVVVIPTNKPVRRMDYDDLIYRTKREKYNAIIEEISRLHEKQLPVLVGTITVEVSEVLSRLLKRRGIQHEVLNAKYHQREAEIVARAGLPSAVTIATNMAGRGTDIKLGPGVVKHPYCMLAPDVNEEGECCPHFEELDCRDDTPCGLHIIGTERHESRRIDRQLRGRSARQGDPGASTFFISLEDDLMRLFGSERITSVMDRLGAQEGEVIAHPLITRSIERAQKKVEARNFDIRKHLLEYDDVMNQQREVIYGRRRLVLAEENLKEEVFGMLGDTLDELFEEHLKAEHPEDWDVTGLERALREIFMIGLPGDDGRPLKPDQWREELEATLKDGYERRGQRVGSEPLRQFERTVLLSTIDERWKEHLYEMDRLKEGIGLRAYGQKNPLIEYKSEGFDMFVNMLGQMDRESLQLLFRTHIVGSRQAEPTSMVRKPQGRLLHQESTGMGFGGIRGGAEEESGPSDQGPKQTMQPIHVDPKVGRNDLCPCGSGKKYKKCCGKNQ
ncbi:MAG: preprotein translocase subunit SecA [Candidatus Latescibacterota bacterium]